MAEETDTTQKPKAELIKRAPMSSQYENRSPNESRSPKESGDHENTDGAVKTAPGAEHGERRKVIVVKKKTPMPTPAGGTAAQAAVPPGTVKRAQPKVVVARGTAQEGVAISEAAAEKEQADIKSVEIKSGDPKSADIKPVDMKSADLKPADIKSTETKSGEVLPREGEAGTHRERTPPPPHAPETRTGNVPGRSEERGSFSISQRPVAAAGKVGGKYVGPRPPHEESVRPNAPMGHRPQGAAGRVGGRPMGARGPGEQGGFRPGGPGGGNRPFGGPGRGPYPPRQGGPGGGFRPGGPGRGPGGPRPGGFGGQQTPPPLMEGKGPVKKSFKAKKPAYTRKEKELEMEEKLLQTKKKITQVTNPVPRLIEIMEVISVSELARKMNLRASDLIQKLMSMGQMVTINQQIDSDTATILASEFGADVRVVSLYDETVIETASDDGAVMLPRPPVVTVMGHVDHGKTKLLDAIRSADVASGEFGGITQHIGAYTVEIPKGKIAFLDTPGHEAFTRMRARGAQVTDIVVLVVAADDGVMPQTIEAINHAKEADVPIIVAVNKIDKPEANPDKVRSQLSDLGLMPEDWGGQTMFVDVSALKKEGIDKLIEAILLQAEMLDLKANYTHTAEGKVLESRIDHGRGIVATVMVERGTLRVGDSFVAGIWPGKVRALFNDKGDKVEEATPSMPIEVLGFEGIPNAGDPLQVVDDEKTARGVSVKRQELKRFEDSKNVRKITLDNLHDTITEGAIQELKVIIKADVQGSAEALRSSLEKLSTKEVRLHVIQALPGAINEGDVDLAIASNALIIGFNVRPVPKAKILADQEKVDIRRYNIIYKAVEEIQQAMEGMLKPDTREEVTATVEVRETFKTPKFGTIAGCYVLTGTVRRSAGIHVIRDHIVIHTGKLSSLRRFKDDVREVAAGFECGIGIDGFDDITVGDQLEIFEIIQVARHLSAVT